MQGTRILLMGGLAYLDNRARFFLEHVMKLYGQPAITDGGITRAHEVEIVYAGFGVDVLANGMFWTHGNATEHMNEALISIRDNPLLKNTNPNLFAQFILYDYRKSLIAATSGAVRLGTRIRVGHWELILGKRKGDEYPVVKHALFSGLN